MTDSCSIIRFGDDGLIPAGIQEARSGQLLMVGFMNQEALEETRRSGFVHLWSRSRQRLWKKGESSGHVQRVEEIRVNCDLNSLLIEVDQTGAVCHDGYDTCYYRRLEPNGTLTIVRDRQFDPRDVYALGGSPATGLAGLTYRWWSVYEWLRDHDFSTESPTSRRLRDATDEHPQRIAEELRELAGVLDGTHRHSSLEADLRLEAGQVLYWTACAGVYQGLAWEDVHPDLALDAQTRDEPDNRLLMKLLQSRAAAFEVTELRPDESLLHDTIALVATILAAHGMEPEELVRRHLEDIRAKPYLSNLVNGQES